MPLGFGTVKRATWRRWQGSLVVQSEKRVGFGRSVMRKQVLAAAVFLALVGTTSGSYAADVTALSGDEQNLQSPTFGPPRGKLTLVTPEALAQELADDWFVAQRFPPTRLIFPDGTQEPAPYVIVRVLKVVPLTGESILKAFAKEVPVDPDAPKSAAVDDTPLVDPHLLFDQRRIKEWSK
jgi:hypothetical protein